MMNEKPTWFYTNAPTKKAALKLMKSEHKIKLARRLCNVDEFVKRMKGSKGTWLHPQLDKQCLNVLIGEFLTQDPREYWNKYGRVDEDKLNFVMKKATKKNLTAL
jgi:hypothetical protein